MVLENKYLRKAIQKSGCVVIVKTCQTDTRKSKIEYISPNASALGMNVELLNKGMKLTEDYIHPEDRQTVIPTVIEAMSSKVDNYTHEYRMVGDDGKLYYVSNEVCITNVDGDSFTMEMYIKDITDDKDRRDKKIKKEKNITDSEQTEKIIEAVSKDKVYLIMKIFSKLSNLYSVYVDCEGKVVYPPIGPATNMGDFHDLFEKPAYKEYYKYIKHVVEENNCPTVFDREEGGIGKISAAPVRAGGHLRGLWIIGSYTPEETKRLRDVYENHWMVADIISTFLDKNIDIEVESAKSKGAGVKLREELARRNIVNDALTKINSKIVDTVEDVVESTLHDVGVHMNIDKAFLYTIERKYGNGYTLRSYWDVQGAAPTDDIMLILPGNAHIIEQQLKESEGQYVVDNSNMTQASKLNLMRYNFRATIVYPIYLNDEIYGLLFFVETKAERVWTRDELRFSKSISMLIQNMIENADGDDNIRTVNKHLIETYNNFNEGIFIRDAFSGEVLFSNTKMNDLMGYDFTGGDSREIITDLRDRFDNMAGVRKPFITRERVVNWRSYIKRLDGIMDITEIQIEWLNGEPASLIILRKAKDL